MKNTIIVAFALLLIGCAGVGAMPSRQYKVKIDLSNSIDSSVTINVQAEAPQEYWTEGEATTSVEPEVDVSALPFP